MDEKYCYPGTDILKNKKGITTQDRLMQAEIKYTARRMLELQENPIKGRFDFAHLKKIHQYIFQDLYNWAGKTRTVDIGKGNLFCLVQHIDSYAESVFRNFAKDCITVKNDRETFARTMAQHYADLNALHPFREGNGRAQREFARQLCQHCGYMLDLSCTKHNEMLYASKLSFDRGDTSSLENIFLKAIRPTQQETNPIKNRILVLSKDDIPMDKLPRKTPTHVPSEREISQMDYQTEIQQDNSDLDGYSLF